MDRARDARLRIKFLSLNHPLCFIPAVKVAFKFFFFFFLNFFIYYLWNVYLNFSLGDRHHRIEFSKRKVTRGEKEGGGKRD